MRNAALASIPPVARLLRRDLRGRDARRAWDCLLPGFVARGYLHDPPAWLAFFALCARWQIYRRRERLTVKWPQSRQLRRAVTQARLRLRETCMEWYLIEPSRVRLAPLNARGEDVELQRIFGRARGTRRRATAGPPNKPSREQALSRGGDRPLSSRSPRRRRFPGLDAEVPTRRRPQAPVVCCRTT